jgi:hypothetical protein
MPRKQLRPAIKLRKKFAPLIELCRNLILTAPPQTSGSGPGDKTISVVVRWAVKDGVIDRPKDFPKGQTLERTDTCWTQRHSVVTLLEYFQAKGYVSYTAADLFAMRLPVMMRLCKMELGLERMLEAVDVEQQVITKDIDFLTEEE